MKGNPTALLPLYAPMESILYFKSPGIELRENKGWFLSQRALHRFLGYMTSQHERMMGGGKRNRVPKRQELIDAYGWDTKYGSHALRLAFQGFEIASHGTLTLPLKDSERQFVLEVKRGEVSQSVVSDTILAIGAKIQDLLDEGKTALPEQPKFSRIQEWAIMARMRHWEETQGG